MTAENRTQRLHRLERIYIRSPIYFVTTCADNRRHILSTEAIHESFVRFAEQGPAHGAWVGKYVLMPDHFHAFVAIDDQRLSLSGDEIALEHAFEDDAFRRDSSAALAEDVFRSRVAER